MYLYIYKQIKWTTSVWEYTSNLLQWWNKKKQEQAQAMLQRRPKKSSWRKKIRLVKLPWMKRKVYHLVRSTTKRKALSSPLCPRSWVTFTLLTIPNCIRPLERTPLYFWLLWSVSTVQWLNWSTCPAFSKWLMTWILHYQLLIALSLPMLYLLALLWVSWPMNNWYIQLTFPLWTL